MEFIRFQQSYLIVPLEKKSDDLTSLLRVFSFSILFDLLDYLTVNLIWSHLRQFFIIQFYKKRTRRD